MPIGYVTAMEILIHSMNQGWDQVGKWLSEWSTDLWTGLMEGWRLKVHRQCSSRVQSQILRGAIHQRAKTPA